jgi:hypothetical protein
VGQILTRKKLAATQLGKEIEITDQKPEATNQKASIFALLRRDKEMLPGEISNPISRAKGNLRHGFHGWTRIEKRLRTTDATV